MLSAKSTKLSIEDIPLQTAVFENKISNEAPNLQTDANSVINK